MWMASNMCAIMPERLASTDPYKQVTEVVGSGPYRFKADERLQGAHFAYERFDGYKPREDGTPDGTSGPKVAHFDRVEWQIIPDAGTAAAALQSGEVDGWEYPTTDLRPLLQRDRKLHLELVYETGNCAILRPNHLFPPFDNPGVRRALLGAIDQTEFMTAMEGTDPSYWKVPCGFFPPASSMASKAGMAVLSGKRDYDKIKRDLAAAGYKGERVALMVSTDFPILKALGDVAAETLKRAGMNVDYQAIDWGTLVQRRASKNPPDQGGWNAFCTGFSGLDFFNPGTHLPLRGNDGQAWFGWPTSPKLEELRDAWFEAPNPDAQKKLGAEIQAQAFEDVPYYPLGLGYDPSGYRADLTGILHGFPIFWNMRRT
jgi:peptide/nickel transport system substrate-binding protein